MDSNNSLFEKYDIARFYARSTIGTSIAVYLLIYAIQLMLGSGKYADVISLFPYQIAVGKILVIAAVLETAIAIVICNVEVEKNWGPRLPLTISKAVSTAYCIFFGTAALTALLLNNGSYNKAAIFMVIALGAGAWILIRHMSANMMTPAYGEEFQHIE